MNLFKGNTYAKCAVELDGNRYEGCTFDSCTFVYSATDVFELVNNQISRNCRVEFRGAAANAVSALQAFFRMGDWGQQTVLATFQQIAPGLKKLN